MNNDPIISWYINVNNNYIQEDEFYLGSFNPNSEINLNIQIWNNRYGSEDVDNIDNSSLIVYFDSLEDSALLQYCYISIDNEAYNKIDFEIDRGVCQLGQLLGIKNNGLVNENNKGNYKNVNIKFKNFPNNLKNGLKNMFLDVVFN